MIAASAEASATSATDCTIPLDTRRRTSFAVQQWWHSSLHLGGSKIIAIACVGTGTDGCGLLERRVHHTSACDATEYVIWASHGLMDLERNQIAFHKRYNRGKRSLSISKKNRFIPSKRRTRGGGGGMTRLLSF